jgi:hypothetical protein
MQFLGCNSKILKNYDKNIHLFLICYANEKINGDGNNHPTSQQYYSLISLIYSISSLDIGFLHIFTK